MQSLVKMVQCAPAVGAKTWCLYVFFVMLRGQRAVRSKVTYFEQVVAVYGSILILFTSFFTTDCAFKCTRWYLFLLLGVATIFVKLRSKISKSPKICG